MSNTQEEQKIRNHAYFLWEQSGYPSGDGVEFWLEAERLAKKTEECWHPIDDEIYLLTHDLSKPIWSRQGEWIVHNHNRRGRTEEHSIISWLRRIFRVL